MTKRVADTRTTVVVADAPPPADPGAGGPAGVLYVVATPIGNLGDVTLRALEVLAAVPLVAAEDTRLTKRLLDRHGVAARMTSFHARSAPSRLAALLEHLRSGSDLALVTDAGTPGVSDPGADLVTAWAEAGGRVVPIPGASAVLAAVAASGVAGPRWTFEGFLPRSGRDRRERLAMIAADPRGSVVYEAPGRMAATLRDLATSCGGDRRAAVCRELTKIHEQIVRGPLDELVAAAADGRIPARGEVAIVIGMRGATGAGGSWPATSTATAALVAAGSITDTDARDKAAAEVDRLVAEGLARGDAARRVSAATGIPRRQLYGGGPSGDRG